MLHLPQYVQLDEDYMGVARMMEAICALYGYPDSMVDTARGESQYREISQGVKNNPGVARLLEHMEREYDLQQPQTTQGFHSHNSPNPDIGMTEPVFKF